MPCFRKIRVAKKFLDKRGGAVGNFKTFYRIFLSHSAKNFRRGGEFLSVSIISGIEKFEQEGGGGEYQDFPSEIFCLKVSKSSVGEAFTVAIISGVEKIRIRVGGSIKIFRGKLFVSQSRKKFVGASFTVAIFLGVEKVWIRGEGGGGASRFSVENFFVSQCRKFKYGGIL